MRQLPGLPNFIKSPDIIKHLPDKFDMYRLKKIEKDINFGKAKEIKLILTYKIKKTKYTLHSCKVTQPYVKDRLGNKVLGPRTYEDGFIVIKKGFQSKTFRLSQLPSGLNNSIAKHFDRYNQVLKEQGERLTRRQRLRKEKKLKTDKDRREQFLKGIDT